MDVVFDPAKNAANVAKHGVSFADFDGFDAMPLVVEDDRYDYGETRWRAFGRIAGVAHCLVFVMRGDAVHAISLRRAHAKEMRRYEQPTAPQGL